MDQELQEIVSRFTTELQAWVAKPSPTSSKLHDLEQQAASLKKELGAGVLSDLRKQLGQAVSDAQRGRLREAADGVAEGCREIGVILQAKEPLKRQRRKKNAASSSTKPAIKA